MSVISKQTYIIEDVFELLPFLLETITGKSRNSVKSILKRGQVFVNGKSVTQHNYLLAPGQTVSIQSNLTARKKSVLSGVTILHEDDDIIVINKDAGLLTVAAKDPEEDTAYRQVTDYVKEGNRKNRIFIVHRLDRDTSGVMLFAKSEAVKNTLQKDWSTLVEQRVYTALVEGEVKTSADTITSWLTESKSTQVYSSPFDNGGKLAVTKYRKIKSKPDYSLLEVELETGRKNQIRVHMQSIGHPVVGDMKYGAKTNPMKRLGLHATTLSVTHPRTGELKTYTARVPGNFHI